MEYLTERTLEEILYIAKQYNKGMNDYGITSPAKLVMKRMPELFKKNNK